MQVLGNKVDLGYFLFLKNARKRKIESDDAFFQPDWAGACWGHWAGSGLLLGWSAGTGVALLCKNKKEEWPAGASPVAAPMPKSVPRWGKR